MPKDDFFLDSTQKKRRRNQKEEQDEIGGNIDDMDLMSDGVVHSDSDAEMERKETPAEKRLRLAKKYLQKVHEEAGLEVDAAEIDRDIIAERLQTDTLEAAGRIYHQIAEKYQGITVTDDMIRTFKSGKNGHQLSITSISIAIPSAKVLSSLSEKHEKQPIYLFSTSKDASIIKWDFYSGQKLQVIQGGLKPTKRTKARVGVKNLKAHIGHNQEIFCSDVSSDGQYLVTGGKDKIIHTWSVLDMKHIGSFKQHRDSISGLVFRKGQNQLYSSSFDRCVKLWNIDDQSYIETLFGHQDHITTIDTLTKERCVTCGARDRSVRLWKIPEESQLIFRGTANVIDVLDGIEEQDKKEKGSAGGSLDVVAMLDEDHFVSGGDNGAISLWSVAKKKPIFTKPKAHGKDVNDPEVCVWITSLTTIPFSDLFASGSGDGQVRLWKVSETKRSFSPVLSIPMAGIVNALKFIQAPFLDSNTVETPDNTVRPKSSISEISTKARDISQGKKCLYLAVGVGQEHRFGRWYRYKGVKNAVKVITLG